jgi:23S rRNA (pseudouridine1915-N3)-methyltransferase
MITILSISDSDKHFNTAIDEYLKRMGKWVTIINLKPSKHGNRDQVIQADTQLILDRHQKNNKSDTVMYLLSKEWKQLSTLQLVDLMKQTSHQVRMIGGPYGLDEDRLKSMIQWRIAFGQITLPHWLAKLTLLEQVYRAQTIVEGKQYHY